MSRPPKKSVPWQNLLFQQGKSGLQSTKSLSNTGITQGSNEDNTKMKKQINPTIKAHLIRGAFYLLLLLAVCAIPFALAQRNVTKRGVVSKLAAGPAANGAAQATKLSGVHSKGVSQFNAGLQSKAASQSKTGSRLLPYDVRGGPDLPRISELPQKTSGARAAHIIPIPRPPKAPQVVLYDQYNNAGTNATLCATFDDFPTFSADLADDFVVPGGQTWNVQSIDADGVYFNGVGPATNWNVFIYANNAGLPGAQVYSTLNQPVSVSGTTFTVNLSPAAVLNAGTYWIEIQANMDFGTQGEWGWTDRTVQSNSSAAWQNTGGGFGVCPTWMAKLICIPTASGPDCVYRINGTSGGGGTPTPTPTGTPAGCNAYITSTGSGTITAGSTDTGNHCDDCVTLVPLPFPVSVYGQTFNSANVASNGSLDLIGTETPFTHGCQVLPSSSWEMAILPYQDDLRTDNISFAGCSGFPGGNCGIFTSTAGSPPNQTFYIEWRATHFADTTTSANFEVVFYENDPSHFDIIYGATNDNGSDETSGVQASSGGPATTFSCGAATLTNGLKVTYTCAGGGGSPTPTPTATGTPGGCTINGSIDTGDPTQTDRLFRSGIPQTCPASTTCATFGDGLPRHYDSYTFTNTTGATQCVNIDTNTACTGTNFIFTGAYLGSFDPANICTNWIGDSGFSPNPDQAFQVNVDNGQTLVVVVSEVTPDAGCPGYTLTITPDTICGGGGSPTPTPTATPTCTGGGGTPGPWMTASPYPTTIVRYGFAQTATHFYVFGGVDNGFATNAVNRMDLATGTWQSRAPMPFGDEAPTCALDESGGIVYCADGFGTNQFAAYNIAGDSWTSLASDPFVPDHYGSASGFFNGQVFVAGGTSSFSNQLDVYNVGTNTWSAGTPAPIGPFLLAGYHQIGQFLYVVGGFDPSALNYATTLRLDMRYWNVGNGPGIPPATGRLRPCL